MTEAMQECWSHFNAQDCVLFDDLVARMQAEAGQNENIGSEEDKANLWRELQHDPVFAEKRYKVNSNRFWHSVEVGWTYSKNWTKFRFALTYLALENNSLSKATLEKFFFQPGAKTSTTAEATAAEERALKGKLSALACAVLFFSDYDRFYKLRMILSVAAPVEAWHRRQSHFCRSSTENAKWFEVQVAGFFFKHIDDVWSRHRLGRCEDRASLSNVAPGRPLDFQWRCKLLCAIRAFAF